MSATIREERELIDRCLAGDAGAWTGLYDHCHEPLVRSIRAFLGQGAKDASLVDEIAARVWYSLVRNDFERLSRFDPNRGCRLITFLAALARAETRLLLRSERRRKNRERKASRPETAKWDGGFGIQLASEQEFLSILTHAERSYFTEVLTETDNTAAAAKYSQGNQWQLRHRVRKKLQLFFKDLQ